MAKKPDGRGKGHQNWKKSPVIGDNGVKTKPGDNTRINKIMLDIMRWGEVDTSNVKELEKRFEQFIEYAMMNDMRVTNMITYYALGIDKQTASDWRVGRTRGPEHKDFIKKVDKFCSSYREFLGVDGKLNPITLVWWQKNYDGFVDKVEHVLTPNNPLGDVTSASDIQKRLEGGVAEDV